MITPRIELVRSPCGVPSPDDFALRDVALEAPTDGEVLVELTHLSLDPYLRLRMAGRHLTGNLAAGDPIDSEAVGIVRESRAPGFKVGDVVAGFAPWQRHAVLSASGLRSIDFAQVPASLALGVLGMPGLTAYAGGTELLKGAADDVVVVSAAAGPVGGTVGQLAKARGARVIGIAGGAAKCAWLLDEAGFDAAIDHHREDVGARLAELAPDRPTCYFDNVGGELLRTMVGALRPYGRVALCGIISDYNSDEQAPGPTPLEIIESRAVLMGLVVYDWERLRPAMIAEVSRLIGKGCFAWREDVTYGLENAPTAFARLMRGETQGKSIVCLT